MTDINLSDIHITAWNPRKNFDEEELTELQASIEQYGILEPLIVRPVNDSYQLVAGERRYRAASNLGLQTVPVVIKELTDAEVHEIMLIENLQRSSLEPLEEAQSLQVILSQGKVTQGELGSRLGKSQAWVANRLRLLDAPEELKELLISRQISVKHVIATLPYVKYPVITAIIEELNKGLEKGDCSVLQLHQIIKDEITNTYENEYTFRIDYFSYKYRDFKELFDFSKCQKCKHTVVIKNWRGEDETYCLNQKCWFKKIEDARALYQNAVNKRIAEMKDTDIIDVSVLDDDSYVRIRDDEIDGNDCKTCDKHKKTKDDYCVCLDPSCYNSKKRALTRARNKAIREEKQRVWDAIDAYLDSKVEINSEWLLKSLISVCNINRVCTGLSKWGEFKRPSYESGNYMDYPDIFAKRIPDDELLSAAIRILCSELLENYEHVDLEKLKKFVPSAVEYYVPAEELE